MSDCAVCSFTGCVVVDAGFAATVFTGLLTVTDAVTKLKHMYMTIISINGTYKHNTKHFMKKTSLDLRQRVTTFQTT